VNGNLLYIWGGGVEAKGDNLGRFKGKESRRGCGKVTAPFLEDRNHPAYDR